MTTEPPPSGDRPDRVSSPTYLQIVCRQERDGLDYVDRLQALREAVGTPEVLARVFLPEAEVLGTKAQLDDAQPVADLAEALKTDD